MSQYFSAGVYQERLAGGSMPVAGVPTATLVVVGAFPDGPDLSLQIETSWAQFVRDFGGLVATSENGYAINGFFANGGARVIPFRVCGVGAAVASDSTAFSGETVAAQTKGVKYNGWTVAAVVNADSTAAFDITVSDASGNAQEKFIGVLFGSANAASPSYVANSVNAVSQYITFTGTGAGNAGTATLAHGNDGAALVSGDIITAMTYGASLLDTITTECLLLIAPDFVDTATTNALIAYADTRRDCYVPCSARSTDVTPSAAAIFKATLTKSQRAAFYWPYVEILDTVRNVIRATTPVGFIAGIYNRTDSLKNVGKNPAGVVDGQINGITGLSYTPMSRGTMDTLYPARINPLIYRSDSGNVVWGCRSLSTDPTWMYINAERLFQFVEKALNASSQWVAFENNTDVTRLRLSSQINGFLLSLFNQGYFAGATPQTSFFVVCDGSNNPPESVSAGYLYADIGIAPSKPAEFVVLRFRQMTLS